MKDLSRPYQNTIAATRTADDSLLGVKPAALNVSADRSFYLWLLLICISYLCVQLFYILSLPLVQDEFQQANTSARLLTSIPYLDFNPYKTVLGYYLQASILLLNPSSTWTALINLKLATAAINAIFLFFGTVLLRKVYSPYSILAGLLFLVTVSTFLERSSAIRVDMLTSWAGWFSLIFLLRKNFITSAILAGLSFLISQKGVYFCIAGLASVTLYHLTVSGIKNAFLQVASFGVACLLPIIMYFGFWALISSPEAVFQSIFVKGTGVAIRNSYDLRHFWWQTLSRNPLYYSLAAVGVCWLAFEIAGQKKKDGLLLLSYLGILTLLCIWHKQPWPYFFVLLIPSLAISIIHFFDGLTRYRYRTAILVFIVSVAATLPLQISRSSVVLSRDNGFQRQNVNLAEDILAQEDRYFTGLNLLLNRKQISQRYLSWLDKPRLVYLHTLDPSVVVGWFEADLPKIVITNYRIHSLPDQVKNFIDANYKFLCLNIFSYAPNFDSPDKPGSFYIPYKGVYKVRHADDNASINGKPVVKGDVLTIKDDYLSVEGRLRIQITPPARYPKVAGGCNPDVFFPAMYTF